MADLLDSIKSGLDKLKNCNAKDAASIKKAKDDYIASKYPTFDQMSATKYIRDEERIIISAPEIIIGNVDSEGCLLGSEAYSKVVIRGGNVQVHASADTKHGGVIECKAPIIKQIAVDPGQDGKEDVVLKTSRIVTQAKSIHIESANDEGCFVNDPRPEEPGLTILSDTTLDILSAVSDKDRSAAIDKAKMDMTTQKATLNAKLTSMNVNMQVTMAKLQALLNVPTPWGADGVIGLRTFAEALWKADDAVHESSIELHKQVTKYVDTLTDLIEVNRKIAALDKMKQDTSSKSGTYKTDSTKAVLNVKAENINILSMDGDGNVRDNATAGMHIQAPHIKVETTDAKGALAKDSNIDINTKTFTLSTANAKYSDGDKHQAGDMPAEGDVNIFSKNVLIEGVDNKLNGGKQEEEKLTAGSTIKVRAEKVSVEATDKDGKATGSVKVNAKDLRLRSMDVDPKSGDEKAQAAGGQMMMLAEKMFLGSNKKSTKLVQVAGEKVGIMGKNTAEVQQDGKAVVTLSGGNMTAGGSAVSLKGNTTIEGNANIKGEAKAPKVSSDQVEAKSAFKSPNINDTMGAGVPGAAGKPSASMSEEEAK